MRRERLRINFYSGVGLDRADRLRRDEAWLTAQLREASTRFVPVWRSRNLVTEQRSVRAAWVHGRDAAAIVARTSETVFLGRSATAAYFAIDLSDLEAPEAEPTLAAYGTFQDLRAVGPVIERGDGAILAYARGLLHWHRRHRYCGVCGGPTQSVQGGHVRRCQNAACGTDHFPRTDPAVIMLVHDGTHCLLGRQATWPPGMHSTLAGFVEPGESLEEAVAREVAEEVGIAVRDVVYHSSQPWPFPASIMLGFFARAERADLHIDPNELAAAGWFSREALRTSPEDETFRLPRPDSIARRLIEDWLAQGARG